MAQRKSVQALEDVSKKCLCTSAETTQAAHEWQKTAEGNLFGGSVMTKDHENKPKEKWSHSIGKSFKIASTSG